eukprot:365535-Chlamydomonas_euryale.AAC.100
MQVSNFRSSFGDGRALCYIVHQYLPELLPKGQIFQPDAPKPEDVAVLLEGDENIDVETLKTKGRLALPRQESNS